ncbi:MAG: tRNA guanosine(34) transglycosylase Tgt [Akkermansiaceae bacterium]|jgi:queuine tRNA-ribosyltransferase|nr:tRNA guanosine(34) transglycosylase Tgt [Akkermansiaceae bacterium]MDP4645720.1 tRNA guanosine(34) transglycosylase Tgt [Akkermansiaceae bacterium]MDP4722583.1 tRNA guanosine(34) transglycosylase Tgt [Akkermansiaceae bacterium]MDP4780407.1 tRNA guanosine(34) transglycosylase Tgt [Akkermansiaceae bacterium]MDP4845906.1 tRNA guanosine(34) transglycosylase Tgt [Akkermansiaceae bacterium]
MPFTVHATDGAARAGTLTLPHGEVETPIFMPVGTQGSVKTLHPDELVELGSQIILGNTYHLWLRPGHELIREMGGLHDFTTWQKPMLTDSGGFQVWSLAKTRKITEEGVRFQSHLDGTKMMLTPELSMDIQASLGSDIAMLFDECPPYPCDEKYAATSLALTTRWAKRCKDWVTENQPLTAGKPQNHFGIVQGSIYADLREQSARELVELGFDGYAVGGVSVGEPEHEMFRAIENAVPFLPADKPRYAMGLGTPPQILEMISRGVDMFDCVMPTRIARHGTAFTLDGPIQIKNLIHAKDPRPLCESSHPHVSRFSRSYIRHLFRAGEMLALRLLSFHNLHFYLSLTRQARNAITAGTFPEFKDSFIKRYTANAPQK